MNTRWINTRRLGDDNCNEAVPLKVPQQPQAPIEKGTISNV